MTFKEFLEYSTLDGMAPPGDTTDSNAQVGIKGIRSPWVATDDKKSPSLKPRPEDVYGIPDKVRKRKIIPVPSSS